MGRKAREAGQYYTLFGDVPDNIANPEEDPDHIVCELEFLAFLCAKAGEGPVQQMPKPPQSQSQATAIHAQAEFFLKHSFPWSQIFCTRVAKVSRLAHYELPAGLAMGFFLAEDKYLAGKARAGRTVCEPWPRFRIWNGEEKQQQT